MSEKVLARYRTLKRGTTRILWSRDYEVYQCEKCKAVLHYQFDFVYCPYCSRVITHTDERRTQAMANTGCGVVVR